MVSWALEVTKSFIISLKCAASILSSRTSAVGRNTPSLFRETVAMSMPWAATARAVSEQEILICERATCPPLSMAFATSKRSHVAPPTPLLSARRAKFMLGGKPSMALLV